MRSHNTAVGLWEGRTRADRSACQDEPRSRTGLGVVHKSVTLNHVEVVERGFDKSVGLKDKELS